jgi:hypothetical protein
VAQAPSQLQQFTHWLESASLQIADSREFQQLNRRIRRSFRKNFFLKNLLFKSKPQITPTHLWGTTIALALLIWNWQLVLALAIGAGVLVSVYLAQQGQWQIPKIHWQQWTGANRSLTLAIATGTIATLSTYITSHIWLEADQSWLAIGIILQGFGTLSILLLLTWQTLDRQTEKLNPDSQLTHLSDADPLKRLIAVRQITQQAQQNAAPLPPAQIADCFRLMLNREIEPSVCSALLEGLQTLGQGRQLNSATRQSVTLAAQHQKVEE